MRNKAPSDTSRPIIETLESRTLLSVSPFLGGQSTFPTRTVLKINAGELGQAITCKVTVCCAMFPIGDLVLFPENAPFQGSAGVSVPSPFPRLGVATEYTYVIPAGVAGAEAFQVGPHSIRATFGGVQGVFFSSTAIAQFRVRRPQFVTQTSGVRIATEVAGSGPALQPGQTATVQYDAYLATTNRLFYSTESQTPDTQTFTVDADPEQVIPGLDAGVIGMQAGETRAIYIPRSLSRGVPGSQPMIQPHANLVYLVTLVSIG